MTEKKLYQSGDFTVTTDRFVHGSQVVGLSEIKFAMPFIDRGWTGMLSIAAAGLGLLAWGGATLKVIGFLLLPGAYAFFRYTTFRKLILSREAGEPVTINIDSTEQLRELVSAINTAIKNRHGAAYSALQGELSALPDAE